ncbi:DNA internalization-related competence protein ComEC/Rec2 [Conchiformibius steedae]|uniref:DNA internalization-related competence protein ComEC/Rec2 n=1 Tax=Conchiformibius steedae TaxID=153493 RepID=A0A3P2A444_9NEIS|nr:DNA internalization-related competence protein ComEC/Rec2 [Conchiformibius steedae]RRD89688.1 DNA internalization-related competence protein ComEC/Rec2 [Conchiformibius steedae]
MRYGLCVPAFCIGAAAAFFLPERGAWAWWAMAWFAAAATAAGAYFWERQRLLATALTLFCLITGAVYSLWRTETALQAQWQVAQSPQSQLLDITVTGLPERSEDGRSRFTATARTEQGKEYRFLFYDYSKRDWHTGERWRIKARVRAPLGMRNPVGFDREAWALANGIDGLASVGRERERLGDAPVWNANGWRARISAAWQRTGKETAHGAGLMRALAVGDRSGLPPEAWAAFRPLGLNHLVSISGLHISMVAVMAALLCKWLMRFLPRVPARPRVWQLGAGVAAAAFYTALAGFGIPALRSLLMLTVFAWAWLQRGVMTAWQVWWTALAAVLLLQPAAVLAAGFWLSFGLVATLLWTLAARLPENKWRQAWRGQCAATLVGGIGAAYFFGTFPVFSLPVNAVAIPLFSWILVPVALAASLSPFDFVRDLAAWLAQYTADVLLWLGARVPDWALAHAPAPLLIAALACALLLLLPRGGGWRPLACCGVLMFALYRPSAPKTDLNVYVWDVGQGLSVLLQTPSQNVLFDTGTPAAEMSLLPNLRALGIKQLDALVLSHHDDDHDGGYPALAKAIHIKKLWAGQPEFYPKAHHCTNGTRWQSGRTVFEFLTPPPLPHAKDNEKSCVLRVIADGRAILITGDLGVAGERTMVAQYGDALYSNVLVLGHHGSKTSTSDELLNAVEPEIAVASSGFANAFRHPHPDVLVKLQTHDIRVIRTDHNGAFAFSFGGGEMREQRFPRQWWQRKPL